MAEQKETIQKCKAVLASLQADPTKVEPAAVAEMLMVLPRYYRQTQDQVAMFGVRDAPHWSQYELSIWNLSETVRDYLRVRHTLRGKNEVLDAIADLVADKQYAKGRQNFVLLLGQFGGGTYGDLLGALLDDPNVSGHAIKALAKGKVPGYLAKVEQILAEVRVGWIKGAARNYIRTFRGVNK